MAQNLHEAPFDNGTFIWQDVHRAERKKLTGFKRLTSLRVKCAQLIFGAHSRRSGFTVALPQRSAHPAAAVRVPRAKMLRPGWLGYHDVCRHLELVDWAAWSTSRLTSLDSLARRNL